MMASSSAAARNKEKPLALDTNVAPGELNESQDSWNWAMSQTAPR
jgi:hypothetical protein